MGGRCARTSVCAPVTRRPAPRRVNGWLDAEPISNKRYRLSINSPNRYATMLNSGRCGACRLVKRREGGAYEVGAVGGERVRAFIPRPLSEISPLQLNSALQSLHERAALALGRLDGLASLLPSPDIFLYAYVRKEAVLSSQIEGT